jgi:glycosyltransferase involved in cell wall biosynthesis
MADLPYVLGIGGIVSPDTFTGRPGLWQLFVLAAEGARGIVCPSRAAARELAEMFGFDVEVVPDGVETSRFDGLRVERQAGLVVGQLAGDDHRARAELLVDSFPAVAQAVPGAELALLGPTGEVRRRALLDRLPEALRSRVVLTGPLDRIRTAVWYARASVTCLPAVRVAFGRPLAESLAAGTPIVGADDGAVPELLADGDDPTGRVRAPSPLGAAFTADDPVSCARALVTVLGDGHDPSRAEACRGRAARYDWSVVGPLLVDLYGRAG